MLLHRNLKILIITILFLALVTVFASAAEFTVFSPKNYVRATGAPVKISDNFSVFNTNTQFSLRIYNGGLEDTEAELVSSSVIDLNGEQIAGPENFNQQVKLIDIPVTLKSTNTLDVEVRGKPGGVLSIRVVGQDSLAPGINIIKPVNGVISNVNPQDINVVFNDDISGINPGSLKVLINGTDKTGFFNITGSGLSATASANLLLSEGINVIKASISDFAGNSASVSTSFTLDITPPQVKIDPVTSSVNINTQTITGSYIEEYLGSIKINGISADIDAVSRTYSAKISLTEGLNTVNVIATDLAGNSGSASAEIVMDTTPPAMPAGLIATAGATAVNLTWAANSESDLAGYSLYRSSVSGSGYVKINTALLITTSYQDTNLTTGNTYYYVLTAQDKLSNESAFSSEVSAKPQPVSKVTALASPSSGYVPLTANLSVETSGNIIFYEWDFEGDGTYDWSNSNSGNVSYTYRNSGTFNAKVRVTDNSGNNVTDSVNIAVNKPLAAIPKATPTSGVKPLTVAFTPEAIDSTGTIIKFEWDYDGNGIWDWNSTLPDTSSYQYKTAGIYNAKLRVTNNYGLTDTKTITISVANAAPLISIIKATPSSGPIPLETDLSCTVSSNPTNVGIAKYEWDFDGDGVFDSESPTTGSVTHTYYDIGTYNAVLRVTDKAGVSASSIVTVQALPVGSPKVSVSVYPNKGNSPLKVYFTGSATSPNGAITKYEWDFGNDGVVDWSSTATGSTYYTYNTGGIFDATLKVTDATGMESRASVRINVNIIISLTRDKDTINPAQGQTIGLTSKYSGSANIKLLVKDSLGQITRVLVNNENRVAGTYTDIWDGKDDNGNIVLDGAYYFVSEATMPGGLTQTYDLTGTGITGTKRAIGGFSATFPATFAPYEGQLCPITYTAPAAGKVVADICPYSYNGERVRALLQFEPQGKGNHTIYWDGIKDDGSMASSNDTWLVTIWSYDLTSNGIIVEGNKPEISGLSVDSNYYCPGELVSTGYKQLNISFSLSETANLIVKIYDATNAIVKTINRSNMPVGQNTISWDGKNENGEYVNDKAYHIGVKAIDNEGNQSLTMYANIILFY